MTQIHHFVNLFVGKLENAALFSITPERLRKGFNKFLKKLRKLLTF